MATMRQRKPIQATPEQEERLKEMYKNKGGLVHIKLLVLGLLLVIGALGCYWKLDQLNADLKKSWDAWDHHCHETAETDPSLECARHLIHINADTESIGQMTTAMYACGGLAVACFVMLGTQSRETLNSKLL